MLMLPSRDTICKDFGKDGLAGATIKHERMIKNVFQSLNDGQKDCFISFDEIHIKPGLHNPKGDVFCPNDCL